MFIVKSKATGNFISITTTDDPNGYPVCFGWTDEKASAVRFPTRRHARAIARAARHCKIVRTNDQ